jgi:hypothetical protein
MGQRKPALICAVAIVLVVDLLVIAARTDDHISGDAYLGAARARAAALPMIDVDSPLPAPTTAAPTTQPPTPVASEPPPTTAAPTTTVPPGRPGAWTVGPYQGTGVWIDVYDWTMEITGGRPRVGLEHIDQMAALGIQTIYIQTAHRRSASDVIEEGRLLPIIDRAHSHGMAVVAWYLPDLVDVQLDLRRLLAAAALPVDGLGVDIESTAVGDPALRTQRLLELSTLLRQGVGTKAISAITLDAVHLQVVNPGFWPGFPWYELGHTYDVIVPMAYWSIRRPEWNNGERYITANIDRIRYSTGRPDMPIHIAGGIADGATPDDVAGMVNAIRNRGVLGGSLYDWNTSNLAQWDRLRLLVV